MASDLEAAARASGRSRGLRFGRLSNHWQGSRDPETLTEVFWSSLHGLASLAHAGRLRPGFHETRMAILVDLLKVDAAENGSPTTPNSCWSRCRCDSRAASVVEPFG